MQRAWRALAIWTAHSIGCAGAPLLAQTAEPIAQVEQYHGVRRVDTVQKIPSDLPAPMPAKPPAENQDVVAWKPALEMPAAEIQPAPEIKDTAKPPVAQPIPVLQTAPNSEIARPVEGAGNDIVSLSHFVCRGDNPSTRNQASGATTGSLGFVLPALDGQELPPQAASAAPPVPERPAAAAAPPSPAAAWIQAGPALVGAVLTPLVLLIGLGLLLRRLKGFAGPVIRIENVGGAPQSFSLKDLAGLLQTDGLRPAPPQPAPPYTTPDIPIETTTAVPFELGPTFAEELLLRQEQDRQQESGLLEKLFEDNVQLQKQRFEPAPVPA